MSIGFHHSSNRIYTTTELVIEVDSINIATVTSTAVTINGQLNATKKITAPAVSATVSGSLLIPAGSGNTPISGDVYNEGGVLKFHNGTAVHSLAFADGSITGSAATLTTARTIYGNAFDGSNSLTQIIASTYGGTGNGFVKFSGPTTTEKTYTLPDASSSLAILGANTFTGSQTFTGGINTARSNVTQHATTMDFWAAAVGNVLDGTGAVVTITAIANAPQAGASRDFYPLTGTILTQGATFDIDGAATRTSAAGEVWTFVAKSTSTYRVFVRKADGTAVSDAAYLGVLQNPQSANYTLALTDAGKHILHPSADTTARTFTIPANTTVAFSIGSVVSFVNQNAGGVITIAITTDTMRLAGAGTTGSRTLAANGVATALKVTSTEWIISGTGLT